MGTSGNRALAVAAALFALSAWSIGCSAPAPQPARSASLPDGPAGVRDPTGPVAPAGGKPCFGAAPAGWTAEARAHTVTTPDKVGFHVNAVAGSSVFGQYESASGSGVGRLDLSSGRLTRISTYQRAAGGVGAMAVASPWVVWEQLDNSADLKDWSMHAWNQQTGTTFVVATSRMPDGSLVEGQQPQPVLRDGRVAWAQPVPGRTPGIVEAELRVLDLATRKSSTIASGRFSSPVFAGSYLVWGSVSGADDFSFAAVDAGTLRPVTLPATLRKPDSIGQLAGSPEHLAWSSSDYTGLVVWRIGSDHYDEFTSHDGVHFFQFMQLAGHYLVWFGGGASSVLDLNTGIGFDVPGTATGSAESIVTTEPVGQPSVKGGPARSRVSLIAIGSAPPLTNCH